MTRPASRLVGVVAAHAADHDELVVGAGGSADEVLRNAESFAALGVSTVMTSPLGADPAATLEAVYGPAMERLGALQPKPL